MRVGTKSVLYGAHCLLLHPWFVAEAWRRLYGFPWDPRLWAAFFVHDLGYVGKPDMDGPEGESHPEFGARVMGALFGSEWADFTRYHSRFLAKRDGAGHSRLCAADKLAFCITPAWLYTPMATWTGEIREYMGLAEAGKYEGMSVRVRDGRRAWRESVRVYLMAWVDEHKDLREDSWTRGSGA